MKFSYPLFLFIFLATSCTTPLIYTYANQISINSDGNFEIIGVSEQSSGKKHIKSPFIFTLDKDLNPITQHYYKTITTASNPRLFSNSNDTKVLSFYNSTSLENAVEQSHVITLDKNYSKLDELYFGKRVRIHKMQTIENKLVAISYNRGEGTTELTSIYKPLFNTQFSLNKEPCMPTDLELGWAGSLFFCGIQNGFHYPDGYDYNEKNTQGFIAESNQHGEITQKAQYPHNQHVFFEDIEILERSILVTGSKQQVGSSMDLLLTKYNDSLSIVIEKSFPKPGIQHGIKTIEHENYFYTLSSNENLENNRMNLSLIKSDSLFNTIWSKDFASDYSEYPVDFIISENFIYAILNVKKINATKAEIHVVSTEGEFIKKQAIQ